MCFRFLNFNFYYVIVNLELIIQSRKYFCCVAIIAIKLREKYQTLFSYTPIRCPVDPYVFPELDRGRNGDTLEANFNAFKIPESNYLIFEANVRTCKDGCQPAYCPSSSGRSEASFGRRKRDVNDTLLESVQNETSIEDTSVLPSNETFTIIDPDDDKDSETPEQVRELIEVWLFYTFSFLEDTPLIIYDLGI